MSHCAPQATLNQIRLLKFTPETVVSNVFVAQVCWQAVPDTCPGNSKAPVAKCVVCAWNSARSVGRQDFLSSVQSIRDISGSADTHTA